jgi:hypothetical protein
MSCSLREAGFIVAHVDTRSQVKVSIEGLTWTGCNFAYQGCLRLLPILLGIIFFTFFRLPSSVQRGARRANPLPCPFPRIEAKS